jgi:FkbM family methyltransferase
MIIYDEMKDSHSLKNWWDQMILDVTHSYPIKNFSQLDSNFKMKTCVDIGCNIGCFSYLASEYFEKIVAFEPGYFTSTIARTKINQKERKRNVFIHNLAVGKNDGDIVKLHCDTHSGQRNSGNSSTVYETENKEYELVTTVSLEKIFSLCETEFIDYLKIDCEGAEYDILLEKDLSKIGMICGEIHGHPTMDFPKARRKLLNHLSLDFNISARKHNFFAINKKFNINPLELFKGELYETQSI